MQRVIGEHNDLHSFEPVISFTGSNGKCIKLVKANYRLEYVSKWSSRRKLKQCASQHYFLLWGYENDPMNMGFTHLTYTDGKQVSYGSALKRFREAVDTLEHIEFE